MAKREDATAERPLSAMTFDQALDRLQMIPGGLEYVARLVETAPPVPPAVRARLADLLAD